MNSLYGFLAVGVGLFQVCLGYGFVAYWLPTRAEKTDKNIFVFAQKASIVLIFGGLFFVFLGFLYLMEVQLRLHFSALFVGLALIAIGYIFLSIYLPFATKKWDTSISIFAQKASFALIIGGLILTILYFLNLMQLMPWWSG